MICLRTVGRDLDTSCAFALHNACFGDDYAWFSAFLEAANGQEYIACISEEEYVGGLFLLDVSLGAYRGKYVYALGVLEPYRGMGIAKDLLRAAKALSPDFTLICAADEALAATYEKYGFSAYVGGTVAVGAAQGAAVQGDFAQPCTYADIDGMKLAEPLFTFALAECGAELYTDGKTVVAKAKDGVYAAWGSAPRIEKKAQLYLKTDMDTSGITADLILEI